MFFKKKYHTLKIKHLKFNSLKRVYSFTASKITDIKLILDDLKKENGWKVEVIWNGKDKGLALSDILYVHNILNENHVSEIPKNVTSQKELLLFLNHKK